MPITLTHNPVTLAPGSDAALTLIGQQENLADVLTPAEHTAIGVGAPHHATVTLDALADILLALIGQQISLDTQLANLLFVGPAAGPAAAPTFRAMVLADLVTHGAAQHTDVPRTLFFPIKSIAGVGSTSDVGTNRFACDYMDNNQNSDGFAVGYVPEDFVSLVSARWISFPQATGNLFTRYQAGLAASGQTEVGRNAGEAASAVLAAVANTLLYHRDMSGWLTPAAGDTIGFQYVRVGTDVLDTCEGQDRPMGVVFVYNARQ